MESLMFLRIGNTATSSRLSPRSFSRVRTRAITACQTRLRMEAGADTGPEGHMACMWSWPTLLRSRFMGVKHTRRECDWLQGGQDSRPLIDCWEASLQHGESAKRLGFAATEVAAARLVDRRAITLFGNYARLNFPVALQGESAPMCVGELKELRDSQERPAARKKKQTFQQQLARRSQR
jgi:hypothetical protein